MRRTAAALALVLLPLVGGCGGDPTEDYCAAVREHRAELTDIISGGGQDALLRALDIFEDLQSRAPSDISDEWQQVVGRARTLDEALRDADVDPASYDRDNPPEGLSDEERARIDAAARELGGGPTLAAFQGIEQEVRDVCQTPLTQ